MSLVHAIKSHAVSQRELCGRASEGAFFVVTALLFAASAVGTILMCGAMSTIGEITMPGGWTMSMAWMRMPGQTWAGAAAIFLGMWIVMMPAMMLPSLIPVLHRYREAIATTGAAPLGGRTVLVAIGYFTVWTAFGMASFPLGAALTSLALAQPALASVVPIAVGAVVLVAGGLQFTAWKSRHLACCRPASVLDAHSSADAVGAFRLGLRLGLHCCHCCAGPMTVLMTVGIMDVRAMALVTTAITLERLARRGERAARANGVVGVAAGLLLIARAAGID